MSFKFVSVELIEEQIRKENLDHVARMEVLEIFLEQIQAGHSLFHEEEKDKYFLVEKGRSVPAHMQHIFQSSAVHKQKKPHASG